MVQALCFRFFLLIEQPLQRYCLLSLSYLPLRHELSWQVSPPKDFPLSTIHCPDILLLDRAGQELLFLSSSIRMPYSISSSGSRFSRFSWSILICCNFGTRIVPSCSGFPNGFCAAASGLPSVSK